jgi:hypothetical protein
MVVLRHARDCVRPKNEEALKLREVFRFSLLFGQRFPDTGRYFPVNFEGIFAEKAHGCCTS